MTPPRCCRSVLSDGTIRAAHRLLRTALQDAVSVDNILVENVARNLRLNFTGDDEFPDLMAFVGTQVDTFAAAFRRRGRSLLLP